MKLKYINIKFLIVKKRVQSRQLSVEHIGTNSMIVDPLTKGLTSKMFHEHTAHMNVVLLKYIQFLAKSFYFICFYIIDFFSYFNLWIFKVIFCRNKVLVYSHSDFGMV